MASSPSIAGGRAVLQGVSVQTPLGSDTFIVRRFEYVEELGEPFQLTLELESAETEIAAEQLVGKQFTVTIPLSIGGSRYFNAFMESFSRLSQDGRLGRYRAVGIPWYALLKRTQNSQIFCDVNLPDMISQVFAKFPFASYNVLGFYPRTKWESRTQYRESCFNFIQRSLQQEGVYYFWTHEQSKHTLNSCDNVSNHAPFPGYKKIPYLTAERGQESQEHVYEWNIETALQPGSAVLKDYNYAEPTNELLVTGPAKQPLGPGPLEVFDHPGLYQTKSDGDRYAEIRIEEMECRQRVFRGRAQCLGLAAGFTFSLQDFPVASENGTYLTTTMRLTLGDVAEAEEDGRQGSLVGPAGSASGSAYWYDCEFAAIASSVQYRSRFSAVVPQVFGLQTAFVHAPDGQDPKTPYTDQLGRIQLMFPWSRDGQQTAWVRKAQVMAGDGWGHMHCPRQGDEVLVAFEHGIVDRPVIVGCLYNGNTKPPLPLPDAAHIHVFKDQGGNLFTLNPQEDGQTVTLSSPVASTVLTLGGDTPNPS